MPTAVSTYRNVLRMVAELHLRGFQRLRIAPGMAPSGMYWRCSLAAAQCFSSTHGAILRDWNGALAHYTSGQERRYFGWVDAAHKTPSQLADLFIQRFPEVAQQAAGSDWPYAGWYVEMLHLTYPQALPVAYADWELPSEYLMTVGSAPHVRIPLPPPPP